MGKKIEMIRGTTKVFNISITNGDGTLYVLAEGEEILFGVKQKVEDESTVILKSVTTGTDGVYPVEIEPNDTINLQPGSYVYDVGLKSGDDYFNVIEPSTFTIKANVTKWGDGA